MFLKVTFDDDSTLDIGLSNSHTVQVISPTNTVEGAFAVGGVKDITFEEGDPVVAPAQVTSTVPGDVTVNTPEGAVVPAPGDPNPLSAPSETLLQPPADATTSNAETTVTDVTVPDGASVTPAPDPLVADGSTTSSDPPSTSSTATSDAVDPHTLAVTDAASAVATIPAAVPDDKPGLILKAQQDLEDALGLFPDSQPLLDLKAQLDQLAA